MTKQNKYQNAWTKKMDPEFVKVDPKKMDPEFVKVDPIRVGGQNQ